MARKLFSAPKVNFGRLLNAKKGYLASVYMLLAVQIGITSLVVTFLRKNKDIYAKISKLFWLWFFLSLIMIFVMAYVKIPMPVRLLAFTILSILIGFNLISSSRQVSPEAIKAALLATLAIFILMTVLGFGLASMGINIGFMSFTLLFCLLALVIAWIIIAIFGGASTKLTKGLLMFGILLFSIFICYDTNVLLLTNNRDVVEGAIGLYLDLINLFSSLLGLDLVDE